MAELATDIDMARDALARGSWADAYESLRVLDPSEFTARDLEGLADAAWWMSRPEESIAARQKAYAAYAGGSEDPAAASMAVRLCVEHFQRNEPPSRAAGSCGRNGTFASSPSAPNMGSSPWSRRPWRATAES